MKNNFFVFNSYSRKGNLPILIFVIMTFVVCSYTLFIFLTNSPQVKAAIINVDRGFDSIYDQEAETRFFLRDSFEKALIKTYEEFVVRGDYLSNLRISQFSELQGIYYSGILSQGFKTEFIVRLKENFKKDIQGKKFEKSYLNNLQKDILDEKFEIMFKENKNIEVKIDNSFFDYKGDGIETIYNPVIKEEINFTRTGLEEVENFVELGSLCSGFSEIDEKKEGYETKKGYLDNFEFNYREIEISEDKKELVLDLKSKREFLIDNDFKKIEFSFIPY